MPELSNSDKAFGAVTYIVDALFGNIFTFSPLTEDTMQHMLLQNVLDCSSYGWSEEYRFMSDSFFDWFMSNFPAIYYGLLKDHAFVETLYFAIYRYVDDNNYMFYESELSDYVYEEAVNDAFKKGGYTADLFQYDDDVFSKWSHCFASAFEKLNESKFISRDIDRFANNMTESHRYQLGFVVCNFMYIFVSLMYDPEFYKYFNLKVSLLQNSMRCRVEDEHADFDETADGN